MCIISMQYKYSLVIVKIKLYLVDAIKFVIYCKYISYNNHNWVKYEYFGMI